MKDGEIFSAYLPTPKGPVFMSLIEKTFGKSKRRAPGIPS